MALHTQQSLGRFFKGNPSSVLSACGSCCQNGLAYSSCFCLPSPSLRGKWTSRQTQPNLTLEPCLQKLPCCNKACLLLHSAPAPALCLSRWALRGLCLYPLSPHLHSSTHCFLTGLSPNRQFHMTYDFKQSYQMTFSLPTWKLSSLNPTVSAM